MLSQRRVKDTRCQTADVAEATSSIQAPGPDTTAELFATVLISGSVCFTMLKANGSAPALSIHTDWLGTLPYFWLSSGNPGTGITC